MSVRFLSIFTSSVSLSLATDSFSSLLTVMLDIYYLIVFHGFVLYLTVRPPDLDLGTGVSILCMVFIYLLMFTVKMFLFYLLSKCWNEYLIRIQLAMTE